MNYYPIVPGDYETGKPLYDSMEAATHARLTPYPWLPLFSQVAYAGADDIVCIAGCGFGRPTHYLMEVFKAFHVRPKLYAFDTFGEAHTGSEFWEGHPQTTPWGEPFAEWAARIGGPSRLLDQFVFHLNNSPARDYLTDFAQFPWWTVAEEFKDSSVSWVVANGAHKPKGIRRELDKWWPKLKSGGRIAWYGHDAIDYAIKVQIVAAAALSMSDAHTDIFSNHIILIKS